MLVRELQLKNFRSYEGVSLEFSREGNVFCGANAQGKTNLLEAIYLCSCARSHRTGRDSELIRNGATGYEVFLAYTADNGSEGDIRIVYEEADSFPGMSAEKRKTRTLYHNDLPLERVAELFGIFHAVIFAPEDLMLVKEGPAGRRRFLDILISQLSPSYFRDLQLYQRILTQRNQLLKRLRDNSRNIPPQDTIGRQMQRVELEIWDEQMAACGARIMAARKHFTEKIEGYAATAVRALSDEREELQIEYRCVSGVDPSADPAVIQSDLSKRLQRSADEDILKGYTSQGPHRDDLELSLNQLPIKQYASQGQQRSVVLALKLAELSLIEEECREKPVLLLDDVMSELDGQRRSFLMNAIAGRQVFITCTDRNQVYSGEEMQEEQIRLYTVSNSKVQVENSL